MKKRTLARILLSRWAIGALLTVAWGPLFVMDIIRGYRPDLNDNLVPWAMGWLGICWLCTLAAGMLILANVIRWAAGLIGRMINHHQG